MRNTLPGNFEIQYFAAPKLGGFENLGKNENGIRRKTTFPLDDFFMLFTG